MVRIEKKNIHVMQYGLVLFIWGILVSVLVPMWQTPDECTHLNLIGESFYIADLGNQLIGEQPVGYGRIAFHSDEKLDLNEYKQAFINPYKINVDSWHFKGIRFSVIKHLPAAVGIIVALILHFPVGWVLAMGEICSLLFYIVVACMSLRMIPIKKEVLAIYMGLPMCVQQAASINYDSVLMPIVFFYISYVLYLKFQKSQIYLSDLFELVVLLLLIAYIKVPYVLIGGLLFILPINKIYICINGKRLSRNTVNKIILVLALLGIVCAAFGICKLKENNYIQLIWGCIKELNRTVYLYFSTFKTFGYFLLESFVGKFGWLDTPLPYIYVIVTFGFLIFAAMFRYKDKICEQKQEFCIKDKFIIAAVLVSSVVFVMMSMIRHTIGIILYGVEDSRAYDIEEALYQIPYIGGLQGRYFIPVMILLFILLPQKITINAKSRKWIILYYFCSGMLITSYCLLDRYWI